MTDYKSSDTSLSFKERIKHALIERVGIQEKYRCDKTAEAKNVMATVKSLIGSMMDEERITSRFIKAVQHDSTDNPKDEKRLVEIWTFDGIPEESRERFNNKGNFKSRKAIGGYDGEITIPSVAEEGKTYPTRYILSSAYKKLTDKYVPEESKTIEELILEKLNTPTFDNGKDPETGKPYKIVIFLHKVPPKFKNGIHLVRDGKDYEEYRDREFKGHNRK